MLATQDVYPDDGSMSMERLKGDSDSRKDAEGAKDGMERGERDSSGPPVRARPGAFGGRSRPRCGRTHRRRNRCRESGFPPSRERRAGSPPSKARPQASFPKRNGFEEAHFKIRRNAEFQGLSADKAWPRRRPTGMNGKETSKGRCRRSSDKRDDAARRPGGPVPSGAGDSRRRALLASLDRHPACPQSAVVPCSRGTARATSSYLWIGPQ